MERSVIFFLATIAVVVLICPFTKVEESFSIQAVHDILNYGTQLQSYDHFEFPGVVKRSFIPPLLLSLIVSIFQCFLYPFGLTLDKPSVQILVRALIGSLLVLTHANLKRTFEKHLGSTVALFFIIISATQFHLVFWGSRTIGNTFALITATEALRCSLNAKYSHSAHFGQSYSKKFINWAVATVAIIRFETAIFFAPLLLSLILTERIKLHCAIWHTVKVLFVCLSLVFIVDSYFWNKLFTWPEAEVFYFNIIQNKSSAWGISPWYAYLTHLLPKILLCATPFSMLGIFSGPRIYELLIPTALSIFAFSALPHKEWRFIMYSVPVFNLFAAMGLQRIWSSSNSQRRLSNVQRFSRKIIVSLAFLSQFAISTIMVLVSAFNYPGGYALASLHFTEGSIRNAIIHIDTYSAMTGVTRFGQNRSDWVYNKTESLSPGEYEEFTHLLTSNPAIHVSLFETIGVVYGYDGISCPHATSVIKNVKNSFQLQNLSLSNILYNQKTNQILGLIKLSPKIWIMKKKKGMNDLKGTIDTAGNPTSDAQTLIPFFSA